MITIQNTFDPCSYQNYYKLSIKDLTIEYRDSLFSAIMTRDQNFRHVNTNPTYDFQNILEITELIGKYGYPPKDSSTHDAYLIPTLICKHNPYIFNRYLYDLYKIYYERGVLDDDGYIRYLECLHLGKFGYWYIKSNRNENIKESILIMQNRLKLDNQYPISELCNAYNMELLRYKHETDSLQVIGKYQNKTIIDGIDSIMIYDLGSDKVLMTQFKGYGINTYEMIKVEGKEVYKFNSNYNPKLLSIGQAHIYLIDPNSKNKNVKTYNVIKDDTDN